MKRWDILARIGVVASLALFANSCVPSSASPALPDTHRYAVVVQDIPAEATVVAAEPLLQRLNLQVGPAELPPLAAPDLSAGPPATSFLAAARSSDDAARAIECMTAAIYYEARSEPVGGQRAVAQVVVNRVRDRAFPNSVCGVVYQGSDRATGCQFSFTCDGSLNRPRDAIAWNRAHVIALGVLSGETDPEVGSATHYHATSIFPWWAPSLRRVNVIGHHAFYRWAAPLERALSFRQRYAGSEPGGARDVIAAIDDAGMPQEQVNGVTIHRSAATPAGPIAVASATAVASYGVAVHRGSAPAPSIVVAQPDVAASSSSGTTLHGVRVHRSIDSPTTPGAAPAGAGAGAAVSG